MKRRTINVRTCRAAAKEHRCARRQYAHTFHRGHEKAVCVAPAFFGLPDGFHNGILAHEVGHLLAGYEGSETEANRAVNEAARISVKSRSGKHGKRLEWISERDAARLGRRFRFRVTS
jgi:hypothetical protein